MDKLPEIFGFKAEVPLADGIGGEGVELFDPRADDEFRERARLVQRLRGGFTFEAPRPIAFFPGTFDPCRRTGRP